MTKLFFEIKSVLARNEVLSTTGFLTTIPKVSFLFCYLKSGQLVVHEYLHPVPKVPEPEPEYPAVSGLKVLIRRHHAVQKSAKQTSDRFRWVLSVLSWSQSFARGHHVVKKSIKQTEVPQQCPR